MGGGVAKKFILNFLRKLCALWKTSQMNSIGQCDYKTVFRIEFDWLDQKIRTGELPLNCTLFSTNYYEVYGARVASNDAKSPPARTLLHVPVQNVLQYFDRASFTNTNLSYIVVVC